MKYILIFILALFAVTVSCAVLSGRSHTDSIPLGEVFEGTADGYRGPITVQVRLDNNTITEIVIADSIEDRFVGASAMEELIDIVIENNSVDVDVISGATVSSRGFLDAVNNALQAAINIQDNYYE